MQNQLVGTGLEADTIPLSLAFHNYLDAYSYGYVVPTGRAFATAGGVQIPVYVCNPFSTLTVVPNNLVFDAVMLGR